MSLCSVFIVIPDPPLRILWIAMRFVSKLSQQRLHCSMNKIFQTEIFKSLILWIKIKYPMETIIELRDENLYFIWSLFGEGFLCILWQTTIYSGIVIKNLEMDNTTMVQFWSRIDRRKEALAFKVKTLFISRPETLCQDSSFCIYPKCNVRFV